MLKIDMAQEGTAVKMKLEGMLDSNTSEEFKEKVNSLDDSVREVRIDMEELKYTSSAGLRVILALQNRMDECGGKLILSNVNSFIKKLFDDIGFSDFITIE